MARFESYRWARLERLPNAAKAGAKAARSLEELETENHLEQASGHEVAFLCESLLVSRSGYSDWKERRRQPSPRQRAQNREELAHSQMTYGGPRLAHALAL